jgi:hypothetical protein
MIEPESIHLFDVAERTSSPGILFACYGSIKYVLYDSGECIFEIMARSAKGYYLCGEHYEGINDIFIFLDQIKIKYPDVADWFLFNIKKFT